ncbi:MAG: hypothetical protein HOO06_07750 [Bdellovibrionaceae bacterium]|nr:hypothetical protein [Pseudobdellovibrionaceae bacterium]
MYKILAILMILSISPIYNAQANMCENHFMVADVLAKEHWREDLFQTLFAPGRNLWRRAPLVEDIRSRYFMYQRMRRVVVREGNEDREYVVFADYELDPRFANILVSEVKQGETQMDPVLLGIALKNELITDKGVQIIAKSFENILNLEEGSFSIGINRGFFYSTWY